MQMKFWVLLPLHWEKGSMIRLFFGYASLTSMADFFIVLLLKTPGLLQVRETRKHPFTTLPEFRLKAKVIP
jgi:hypothetical protein